MNFQDSILQGIQDAFTSCFQTTVSLDQLSLAPTKKEFEGDLTIVLFSLLKEVKASLPDLAKTIGDYLQQECDEVKSYSVVKGFLN